MKYWLYQEEVYEEMIKDPLWEDYKLEQCQQDLSMLTEWKNLNTIQDTRKVTSIEGPSLEPTLLERIRIDIERMPDMANEESSKIYTWWTDLNNDFIRLDQNYQDYIRDLNSVKAEEMMRTKEFLIFKERLIEYLRSFIKGLQRNVGVIEKCLRFQDEELHKTIFQKIVDYELLIPSIDGKVSKEMVESKIKGRFKSIYDWFVGSDGQENEAAKLFDATNEIIRRITRYAATLSEKNALGANRKEEYKKIAKLFMKCDDVAEAHKISAIVFGMERPFHI